MSHYTFVQKFSWQITCHWSGLNSAFNAYQKQKAMGVEGGIFGGRGGGETDR
jgi:hypothetical protein